MAQQEDQEFTSNFVKIMIDTFKDMPLPVIIDSMQANITLYKEGRINPIPFGAIIGAAATAFMNKVVEQANMEFKIQEAQPDPKAN